MFFFESVSLLLHLFDLVLQDFNVQFKLLFDLDVVADLKFILLKLLLILFGWKIQRLKGRRERREPHRVLALQLLVQKNTGGSVTRLLFKLLTLTAAVLCNLLLFKLHLHEDFNGCSDVVQDSQAVEFQESVSLLAELVFIEIIDLNYINKYRTQATSSFERILT